VLSDEKKRRIYDQHGEEGLKQQEQQQQRGGGGHGNIFDMWVQQALLRITLRRISRSCFAGSLAAGGALGMGRKRSKSSEATTLLWTCM
jgi:DnaJ-class molecular chaperone